MATPAPQLLLQPEHILMLQPDKCTSYVRFEKRAEIVDEAGNYQPGPWTMHCERWVAYKPDYSRERVAQGRLADSYVGTATTYRDPEVDLVTADMRVVFLAGPQIPTGVLSGSKVAAIRTVTYDDAAEVSFILETGAVP